MGTAETLRNRLSAAGVNLPEDLTEAILLSAGPLVGALDELATLDLGDVEAFCPACRLPADAKR
jgi:hypothetical protein